MTVIDCLSKAKEEIHNLKKDLDNSGSLPANSGIFKSFIDENKMASCIIDAKQSIMGERKKTALCGRIYDFTDFCVLTQFVLLRMHFLENKAQNHFCEFLQKKVFKEKAPKVRSFNNHANKKYRDFDKTLAQFEFNPLRKPDTRYQNDFSYMFCHDMIRIFHKMDYFRDLRQQRNEFVNLIL